MHTEVTAVFTNNELVVLSTGQHDKYKLIIYKRPEMHGTRCRMNSHIYFFFRQQLRIAEMNG